MIRCGICGRWGLFGGALLHPKTGRPTSQCVTCRDVVVVVSRQEKTYKPPTTFTKQEESQ